MAARPIGPQKPWETEPGAAVKQPFSFASSPVPPDCYPAESHLTHLACPSPASILIACSASYAQGSQIQPVSPLTLNSPGLPLSGLHLDRVFSIICPGFSNPATSYARVPNPAVSPPHLTHLACPSPAPLDAFSIYAGPNPAVSPLIACSASYAQGSQIQAVSPLTLNSPGLPSPASILIACSASYVQGSQIQQPNQPPLSGFHLDRVFASYVQGSQIQAVSPLTLNSPGLPLSGFHLDRVFSIICPGFSNPAS
ncbi:hypothetical protein J6590_039875 [Homalodisca vitripennis]|nr:hypothetical protein J6590_039875 [Homalodisca vitripennis]